MEKYKILYDIFSSYNKPQSIEACPCCMNDNEINLLLTKELQNLTSNDLCSYATVVFQTVGSKKDYMYFFPRILELCLENKLGWPDPEIVFRSIRVASWEIWKKPEKNIVLELFKSKFIQLAETADNGSQINQLLCAISFINNNINKFLHILEKYEVNGSYYDFIECNLKFFTTGRLTNKFWRDCPKQEQQVIKWLHNDKVSTYLYSQYGMSI